MYKNKADKVAWEQFLRDCDINHNAISLGANCSVNISNINNEICLEIMPNETTDFLGDVVGVTVKIDENNFCVKSVMGMANNAKKVVESKKNKKPIKLFMS